MKPARLLVLALVTACAHTPDPLPDPCKPQGRRYVKEAFGANGRGLIEDDGVEGGVEGAVAGDTLGKGNAAHTLGKGDLVLGQATGRGVLRVSPGSEIVSIFGRDRTPGQDHSKEPFEGARIEGARIAHQILGRDGKADGKVTFTVPMRARLEASTTVKGYGFNVWVGSWSQGAASFWVGCRKERADAHTVDWTFTLLDDHGRRSNSMKVPVECTGGEMPGRPPTLDAVDLDGHDLIGGGRTGGVARFSGTHPPLRLIARSDTPGYGWEGSPNKSANGQQHFSVGCRKERQLHGVRWRFSIKDTFGRESNVVEKRVYCGVCVEE